MESVVNLCLLLRGRRKLIQFDHYLYNEIEWDAILQLLSDPALSDHIFVRSHNNDKLVFTDAAMNSESTAALSQDYLDNDFYSSCTYDINNITQGNGYGIIQTALDSSANGDTIIINSGTYTENLTITTNIVLASQHLLTNDTSYISSTDINYKFI